MSDKRTVSTDALETLGMIHYRQEKRDAIHLAVLPVIAARSLKPGADVGIKDGRASTAYTPHVGIVDPFLSDGPASGQSFWLVIYPRKIQSLRHVWSHPGIPEETPAQSEPESTEVTAAKAAVHWVACDLGISDEALMDGASNWISSGGSMDAYMHFGDDLNYGWDMEKFWAAYSLLTGNGVPEPLRTAFFSCSC